jgi:hypothetical protein
MRWSSTPADTRVGHATRSSTSRRGCNPGVRRLLIPCGATFCFGLKARAKTAPRPSPSKRNVIAEFKSYSLSFVARCISTSFLFHALLSKRSCKMRSSQPLCGRKNRATSARPFLFLLIRDPQGFLSEKFRPFKRQEFSRRDLGETL